MTMNRTDAVRALRENLDKLSARDRAFATSLLGAFALSAKQEHWVGVLAERALEAAKPAAPKAVVLAGVGMARIRDLFAKAAQHLRRPRITFGEVVLSLAGAESRNPGCIYVKRGDVYRGKITPAGDWMPTWEGRSDDQLLVQLYALAADPVKAAAAYGHQTGACCFCNRELTDARSVGVGYGPICAGNYGLPWGEVRAEPGVVELDEAVEA